MYPAFYTLRIPKIANLRTSFKNMKLIITFLSLLIITTFAHADDTAVKHCKKHLVAIFSCDLENLKTTYGEKIHLVPGHDFANPEHKLNDKDPSKAGLTVTRDELLKVIKAQVGNRKPPSKDIIEKELSDVEYMLLSNKAGRFIAEPSDPIETADGKLHFELKEGDLLYKAQSPSMSDFLLFQLRKVNNKWVIVSEYFD